MNIKILISNQDEVGKTVKKLGYKFEEINEDVIDFNYNSADAIVVICRHESSAKIPSLTVHHPGNPGKETMGGQPFSLGIAFPKLITSIYREIIKIPIEIDKVFEATHHGPTSLNIPVVFAEVGSDKSFWNNENIVRNLVEAVLRGIENLDNIDCEKIITGIGGPHYAYNISKLAIKSCISHIISKHYISEINSNIMNQLLERSINKPNTIVFDSVNKKNREKILSLIYSNKISIESI
ncbi:D-aminoacyl-tRNA deacylase [Acidianus sulfidivorans JP7]|uniref:D-tyrosyl-tRNA(Tyr) deacylase n=1 Tax=Acidianus sulfidivorans JP7 TaxID=619593 RepID=A0A2U9IKL6_9CREN|nr:D-aminoacyl-tRNA deacylase [Acidianus sulfidivorans]AWR96535.1 D-aminoacyl-tRNA deacylase [Acidianus sulfidivorans JP7]